MNMVLFVLFMMMMVMDLLIFILSLALRRERKRSKTLKKEISLLEARKRKLENIENELRSKLEQV